MKAQSLFSLILLGSMATLISCGGGNQSEAKLEISKSFVTDGTGTGSAGLLIHGMGPNNQTFTFAIESGTSEKTVKLNNGLWSFYAIGWAGTQKFSGTPLCALAKQDISANATIDLTIKSENCNENFRQELALHEFKTLTCGSFKTYDSAKNIYNDLTASTPDTFCSTLPMGQRSELHYFKVVALESALGNLTPSPVQSSCMSSTTEFGAVNKFDHFPMAKLPFAIKAYRSFDDCQNNRKHQIFQFPKGIMAGNPENFDHQVLQSATAPVQSRLILPSSITKRGRSLFENMLPQFLCGTSGNFTDCFEEPTLDFHIYANWWEDKREHLIQKNTNWSEESAHLCAYQSTEKKFSIQNCKVDDGNLYGEVKRQEHLDCQDNSGPQVMDTYSVGNSIYKLTREWDGSQDISKIVQYNHLGQEIKVTHTPLLLQQIAVDPFGVIYGSDFTYIHNLSTGHMFYVSGSIGDIQIQDSFLIAVTSSGYVESFSLSNLSKISSLQTFVPDTFRLQVFNNSVYFFRQGMSEIIKVSLDPVTGSVFGSAYPFYTAPAPILDFTFRSDGTLFVSTEPKIYHVDSSGAQINFYYTFVPATNLAMLGPKLVGSPLSSSLINIYKLSGNTATVVNQGSECRDTVLIGGKSLDIFSTYNSGHISNINTYTQLVRNIGLRNITDKEHPYYLFDMLHRDSEDAPDGGGYLSDVHSDLSSTGILGVLRTGHKTCEELALAAKIAPVKTSAVVNHYLEGEIYEIDFEVSPSTAPVPFCNIAGPGCLSDLKVRATIGSLGEIKERIVADLKCGQAAGKYEVSYFEDYEEEQELIIWNTQDMSAAAFEYYSHSKKDNNEAYREVVKAKKLLMDEFWLRSINTHKSSHGTGAQIVELQRNATYIFSQSQGSWDSDYNWPTILTNKSFEGTEGSSCFDKNNTSLFVGNNYCEFTLQETQTSNGLELSIDALINTNFLNTFSLKK